MILSNVSGWHMMVWFSINRFKNLIVKIIKIVFIEVRPIFRLIKNPCVSAGVQAIVRNASPDPEFGSAGLFAASVALPASSLVKIILPGFFISDFFDFGDQRILYPYAMGFNTSIIALNYDFYVL